MYKSIDGNRAKELLEWKQNELIEGVLTSGLTEITGVKRPFSVTEDEGYQNMTIKARNTAGNYVELETDSHGFLQVAVPVTAFNELLTNSNTPIFNGSFLYDRLNAQLYNTFEVGGGTVSVQDSVCSLSITGLDDYAVLRTNKIMRYFPGTSNTTRFSVVYDTPVPDSIQRIGLGKATSEFSIGYDGDQFGVLHAYGGVIHQVSFQVLTPETGSNTYDIELNGVLFTVNLTAGTIAFTAASITQQLNNQVLFGFFWNAEQIGDTVNFTALGVGAKSGGYSITAGPVTGTFTTIVTGADLVESWVYEADFNTNSALSQSLDKTLGNVYQIRFSWLGYNLMEYSAIDPSTGSLQTLHTIYYANTSTEPTCTIPSFPVQAVCSSQGSTTPLTMKVVSMGMFTESVLPRIVAPRFSFIATKTISSGSEVIIEELRCNYSVNGFVNQSEIVIDHLSVLSEAGKAAIIRIIRNPDTLGTASILPQWSAIDVDSFASTDEAAVVYTGGTFIDIFTLQGGTARDIYYERGDLVLNRGDILLITAEFPSGTAADFTTTLNWIENI